MSTKTKSIAFHKEGERLTMKSQKPKEENLGVAFIQALLLVGVMYILANLLLGWN